MDGFSEGIFPENGMVDIEEVEEKQCGSVDDAVEGAYGAVDEIMQEMNNDDSKAAIAIKSLVQGIGSESAAISSAASHTQENAMKSVVQAVNALVTEARAVIQAAGNTSATMVATTNTTSTAMVSYEEFHVAAKSAYQCLSNALHDLLLPTSTTTSEHLQSLGKELYLLVWNNPCVFSDSGLLQTAESNSSFNTTSNPSQNRSQDPSIHHQGACSAYVRHISATLVLIHCFAFQKQTNNEDERSMMHQPIILEETTTHEQLTFGLVTFLRAGRAMMNYAENPLATYHTLSLALTFWKGLQRYHELRKEVIEPKYVEDAFDAYSLLPDAAYLVFLLYAEEHKHIVGSPDHVGTLINDLVEFVQTYCLPATPQHSSPTKEHQTPTVSLICIQRFFPTLARLAYKHGNRLARECDYENAKIVLSHVLTATNRCVQEIQRQIIASSISEDNLSINRDTIVPSLHIQEQEMIVLTKESLYVLAYIHQATNMIAEAHECLDRIQHCISDQCKRDEELYQKTMRLINTSDTDIPESELSSSLYANMSQQNKRATALILGPKRADEADIRTRAQAAKAAAKHAEVKERANLAFTCLTIYHRSSLDGEDKKRNEQLEKLITLISSSSKAAANPCATTSGGEYEEEDEDIFQLALTACRLILVKNLTTMDDIECLRDGVNSLVGLDPYEKLAARISLPGQNSGASYLYRRPLIISIDCVKAILSSAQIMRDQIVKEKSKECSSSTVVDQLLKRLCLLDDKAVEKAQSLTRSLQEATAECKKNVLILGEKHSTFLVTFIQECRGNFSRALDLHRIGGNSGQSNHSLCITWADLILHTTSLLSELLRNIDNSAPADLSRSAVSHRNDLIAAEVMAIKALSLSSSGMFQQSLSCGRIAWENACEAKKRLSQYQPSCSSSADRNVISCSYNLAVLFHCTLLSNANAFSGAVPEILAASDSVLLELEDALSHLSHTTDRDEIIDVFPTLLSSCEEIHAEGTGLVQLGIKERWITMLMGSEDFLRVFQLRQFSQKDYISQIDQMLNHPKVFSILRAFLFKFETLFDKYMSSSVALVLRTSRSLVAILDELLNVFVTIRDRHDTRNTREVRKRRRNKDEDKTEVSDETPISSFDSNPTPVDEGTFRLIWDNDIVKKALGTHHDCVCLAEQLWNTASLLVANIDTKVTAAELFTKAHDFALLSEEEEGKALSRGFLDFDHSSRGYDSYALTPFVNKLKPISDTAPACDLSSEFSAQCLLLAVASVVDAQSGMKHEGEGVNTTPNSALMRKSIRRLEAAYYEIILNRSEEHTECDARFKHFVVLLALCCTVETGDDSQSMTFLSDNDTMKYIFSSCANGEEDSLPPEDYTRTLAYLYFSSKRAEANGMNQTSWTLLNLTCRELLHQRRSHIDIEFQDYPCPKLGVMQQKLIQSASSVEKTLSVFGDVNKVLTTSSTLQNEILSSLYSGQEMDWFAVESYNRGVNLVFLGDMYNAERLIALALNFLQYCTDEVKLHGPEMRNGYRGVIQRKENSRKPSSVCSNSVVRLFGGFNWTSSGHS